MPTDAPFFRSNEKTADRIAFPHLREEGRAAACRVAASPRRCAAQFFERCWAVKLSGSGGVNTLISMCSLHLVRAARVETRIVRAVGWYLIHFSIRAAVRPACPYSGQRSIPRHESYKHARSAITQRVIINFTGGP